MDPPHPVNWSPTHSTGPQTLLSVKHIFQKCIFQKRIFQKCIYLECIFAKCTRLACFLSFASLFYLDSSTCYAVIAYWGVGGVPSLCQIRFSAQLSALFLEIYTSLCMKEEEQMKCNLTKRLKNTFT